jgi:cytochrome P450
VLKKHRVIKDLLVSILGSKTMLITEGAEWKRARSAFNPGLTLSHLMTLVPGIVDDSMIFREVLLNAADSEQILQIEVAARYLAIDIMGRVILDFSFNSQASFNDFVTTFLAAVEVLPEVQSAFSPRRLNFISFFKRRYYEWKMNAYLGKVLDERRKLRESNAKDIQYAKSGRKPVIDLALDVYTAQQEEEGRTGKRTGSDQEFRQFAIDNMKTFLQAGYDTTSSTLAYTYYLLSWHPEALERVRAELDQVFGEDANLTADRIKNKPYLISKLDYTTAVVKSLYVLIIKECR